ncbi:uncharacterized protein [Henckelia pumila]|uniref:uncharacterized protein n=1 Tax=Henckelia pumila TaxID=405737 RepID=UPI003C6E4D45
MSCIVWNVRGLGNQRAFRELKRLIADKKPSLLFLCETRNGGLCFIKSYSQGHIDSLVEHNAQQWRFTVFYGNSDTNLRHVSWELIRRLEGMQELRDFQWLIGGDFNEICYDSEKLGGNMKPAAQIADFRGVLDDCNLQSLHCEGDIFTWVNRRNSDGLIFERLDRFASSFSWRMLYPAAKCTSLDFYHSDHRPIHINLGTDSALALVGRQSVRRRFRFEPMWLRDRECEGVIVEGWHKPSHGATLLDMIQSCSNHLQQWASRHFGNIPCQIQRKRDQLERIRNHESWIYEMNNIKELEVELEKLSSQEELLWKQRSRSDWLAAGDKNTKFFHRTASLRKEQNTIRGLISGQGDFVQDQGCMVAIITDYFDELFTTTDPHPELFQPVIDCIEPKVDRMMNINLCAPFTALDVKTALFELGPDKAPGPDGFSGISYQKFWHVVGEEVTQAVLHILNEDAPMDGWNNTIITLIPKVGNPMMMKEFRPIRRLISDNVILGFEATRWIRSRKKGKDGYAALKLDMSKAYDRVEWKFLEAIMNRLGFSGSWIRKVMKCVSSVSYSFSVNQEIVGRVVPSKGIRQGDPLSPYLFSLCAQGLSSMLHSYSARGLFRGVHIAANCPPLTHLFFADDNIIFFRATDEDCARVKECMQAYEVASGQLVNFDKSSISFTPNTTPSLVESIKTSLTILVVQGHEVYLGLPTYSLRRKKVQFHYLVERVSKRLKGWGSKFFSVGGRETLIKSVLLAMPTYAMSCFMLPKATCDSIERDCADFWWGMDGAKRRMHWTTWDFLCQPKWKGGMGFRKLDIFNKALLAKQVWHIIRKPESLVARVLKARYFKHLDIMQAPIGSNPSYIWRSMCWGRELLNKGLYWRVGDGSSINILHDKWVPGVRSTLGNLGVQAQDGEPVSSWITENGWNEQQIRGACPSYIVQSILNIPIPRRILSNTRFWKFDPKRKYSVKSGYNIGMSSHEAPEYQSSSNEVQAWWRFSWALKLPPKIRVFWWRVFHNIIPTQLNLLKHHVPVRGWCPLCHNPEDSTAHSLLYCPAVRQWWGHNEVFEKIKKFRSHDMPGICFWLMHYMERSAVEEFVCQAWMIWGARCKEVHAKENQELKSQTLNAASYLEDYRQAVRACSTNQTLGMIASPNIWQPPPVGFCRLDVDASFQDQTSLCGVGGIIRGHEGKLLAAFGKTLPMPDTITLGELLAIREGIKVARLRGFHQIQVFSDSLLEVQAVTEPLSDLNYAGSCALEIESLCSSFNSISFSHARRTANEVSHSLAKFALFSPTPFLWVSGSFPLGLDELVTHDSIQ